MLESLGVARYKTIRPVGRGGMGELYEVWDSRLERRVAVKRLHPHVLRRVDSEKIVLAEARAAARIEHANVVRVYGVEQAGEELLIEMQFIDGKPLSDLLCNVPLPAFLAVDLLAQISAGLAACHAQDVIHCDLKPANVLVHADGSVYLTDFGIARALRNAVDQTEECDDVPNWGTPRYRPPEAWDGGTPTPLWDIYAAGVLIYEALSGTHAFDGGTVLDVRAQVHRGIQFSIGALRPDLSSELIALIDAMADNRPEQRPQSVLDVLHRLRATPEHRLCGDRTLDFGKKRALNTASPTGKKRRRIGRGAVIVLVAVALLLSGGIFFALSWLRQPKPPAEMAAAAAAPSMDSPSAPTPTPEEIATPALPPAVAPPLARRKPSEPQQLFVTGDSLLFTYDDGVYGRELWGVHNGITPMLIADINEGPGSSNPRDFRNLPGKIIVFAADDNIAGEELWRCNGYDGYAFLRSELVRDINEGPAGSSPEFIASKDNLVFFYASTRIQGRELWWSSGGKQQTAMVVDWRQGYRDSALNRTFVVTTENGFYFQQRCDTTDALCLCWYEFKSDTVKSIAEVGFSASTGAMFRGKLIFRNDASDQGSELWMLNSPNDAPVLLKEIAPGAAEESSPREFFAWGDKLLLFQASSKEFGRELWATDGTAEGTQMLMDINPGDVNSGPYGFIEVGDEVLFRASNAESGREWWVTDGTPAGTHLLADIYPGARSGEPYNAKAYDGRLFFSATDGAAGEELWVAEKKAGAWGVRRLTDINPVYSSFPNEMSFTSNGVAFFRAFGPGAVPWIYRMTVHGEAIEIEKVDVPLAGLAPSFHKH